MRRMAGGVSILVFMSIPAIAAAGEVPGVRGADLVAALDQCLKIADDPARLACLETAGRNLTTAVADKTVAVVDRQQMRETKRALFGYTLPKFSLFGDEEDKEEEFQRVSSTISSARHLGHGKWVLRVADGATWETTEALRETPHANDPVEIRAGTMGGYFIRISDGRSARAKRID